LFDDAVPVSLQAGPDFGGLLRQNLPSYHNYHVSRRQAVPVFSKTLAKQAFQGIALHRPGNLFTRYGEADTRRLAFAVPDQNGDTVVAATKIVLENLLVVARAGQSQPSWKRLADSIGHFTA